MPRNLLLMVLQGHIIRQNALRGYKRGRISSWLTLNQIKIEVSYNQEKIYFFPVSTIPILNFLKPLQFLWSSTGTKFQPKTIIRNIPNNNIVYKIISSIKSPNHKKKIRDGLDSYENVIKAHAKEPTE